MTILRGRGVVAGSGTGPALLTRMPINFTASLSKPHNILPWWRSRIGDHHHDLFGKLIKGTVLIFPACIGSTLTGMALMQLMHDRSAPAAMIVQDADSLLVSGSILAEIWFERGIPIVEYRLSDLFDRIRTGDRVTVNGKTGEISV